MASQDKTLASMLFGPSQASLADIQTRQALAGGLMKMGLAGPDLTPAPGRFQYVPKYGVGNALAQMGSMLAGRYMQNKAAEDLSTLEDEARAQATGMPSRAQLEQQRMAQQLQAGGQGIGMTQEPTMEGGMGQGLSMQGAQAGFMEPKTVDTGGQGLTMGNVASAAQRGALMRDAQQVAGMQAPQAQAKPAPFAIGGEMNPAGREPGTAYSEYIRNPDKYIENFVAPFSKPAAIEANLRAAGIDPRSEEGRNIARQAIQKETNIAPTVIEGTAFNPVTGQVMFEAPKLGENQRAVRDETGRVVRSEFVPGSLENVRALEEQKAIAQTAGRFREGVDAQGNPVLVRESELTGVGQQPQQQRQVATGSFGGYQAPTVAPSAGAGGSFRPALAAGEKEARTEMATANAKKYSDLTERASTSSEKIQTLDSIQELANGLTKFGPGTAARNEMYATANKYLGPLGIQFGGDDAVNSQIMQTHTANIIRDYAKSFGANPSDNDMKIISSSVPGTEMYNSAMNRIIPVLKNAQMMLQEKAKAADAYVKENNGSAAKLHEFESEWRQNADPRIMQLIQLPQEQRRQFIDSQKDAKAFEKKARTSINKGWFR